MCLFRCFLLSFSFFASFYCFSFFFLDLPSYALFSHRLRISFPSPFSSSFLPSSPLPSFPYPSSSFSFLLWFILLSPLEWPSLPQCLALCLNIICSDRILTCRIKSIRSPAKVGLVVTDLITSPVVSWEGWETPPPPAPRLCCHSLLNHRRGKTSLSCGDLLLSSARLLFTFGGC